MKYLGAGIGLAMLVLAPSVAQAQVNERAFVRPLIAANMGSGPGAVFGTSFGIKLDKINPKVQVLAEIGRMTNIMPSSVADNIDVVAAKVADLQGGKSSTHTTASANYGLGGFRYRLRDLNDAQTFAEFMVGAASVRSKVSAQIRGSETLQGDISNQVSTPFTAAGTQTKPMVAIGGGLILGISKMTAVEVGYRVERVFTKNPGITMSRVFGGFRLGF